LTGRTGEFFGGAPIADGKMVGMERTEAEPRGPMRMGRDADRLRGCIPDGCDPDWR